LEKCRRNFAVSCLLQSRCHARGHGRTHAIARPARCLSALGLSVVAMSCKAFQSSSFRCCWSCANAAVSAALTSKNKKPGALPRSGLVKMRQLSLAISAARTRAVLTDFLVIRPWTLAALKRRRVPHYVRCKSFLHNFLT